MNHIKIKSNSTQTSAKSNRNRLFYAGAMSLIGITALSGLVLSSVIPSAFADESIVDVVTINVPVSCSMSASGNTSHTATVNNGQTTENIGTTNIKVICNDNSGYAIYAIGYTDDTYGKTVLTSSTLGSTHDIATATTVTTGTSSWAMKLAATSGTYVPTIVTDFASYHAVPAEYTKVAYLTSSTDNGTNASGSNLTTTYRAYISPTQPAGTYVGQVKYTLVHPNMNDDSNKPVAPLTANDCEAGYVCYGPNASDVDGSMSSLGAISGSSKAGKINVGISAAEITLIAPNYSRPGYGFAGWSTDFEATSSSKIYGPNETITVANLPTDEDITFSSQGLILYPVWVAKETNVTMQTFNATNYAAYNSAPNGTVIALEDTRDNNVYAVAKLADGKWWMIENLRLDDSATITTANTHNPLNTNGTVNLKIDYANGTTANHLASTNDSWCTSNGAACFDQTMLNTNNTNIGGKNASNTNLTPSYNGSGTTSQWYSYGNYYNWYSVTAGNGIYSFSTNNNSVSGDLCPAGWHLPQGGQAYAESNTSGVNVTNDPSTYRDFYNLGYTLVGTTAYENTPNNGVAYYNGSNYSNLFRTFPNNFVYSGLFNGSSANGRGSGGGYWSSSAYSSRDAYGLDLYSSYVIPGTTNLRKYLGFSVRCIAGS